MKEYSEPLGHFEARKRDFEKAHYHYQRLFKGIGTIRFSLFLVFIVVLFYAISVKSVALLSILIPFYMLSFIVLVKWHRLTGFKLTRNRKLFEINADELKRLQGDLSSFDGMGHVCDNKHHYCNDLDILGEHSIFQLINRSESPLGKRKLMEWLLFPSNAEDANKRQDGVKELKEHLDWRQDLQGSYPDVVIDEKLQNAVLQWLIEPVESIPPFHRYVAIALSFLTISMFFLWTIGYLSIYPFLFSWLVNSVFLGFYQKKINAIQKVLNRFSGVAGVYESMFAQVERKIFTSKFLQQSREKILSPGGAASSALKKFKNTLNWFDSRSNFFYWIFNSFFLSDIWLYHKALVWKSRYGLHFGSWLDALAEIESISSLSAFSFANPDYSFPALNENEEELHAVDIAHPLIFKGAISNNFKIKREGSISLVTGSNMSGKSTFLRTLGINMVLAFCGAPVRAANMKLAPVWVFTCMRTQDDLSESISSFYAELLRLNQLLKVLEEGKSVFFLLDEILKGTNSHDRHQGARALIKKLSQLKCSGLISTHDLELGILEDELPGLNNFSFNSKVKEGKLFFDYKIKKGVCRSFNAAHLMHMMGIM